MLLQQVTGGAVSISSVQSINLNLATDAMMSIDQDSSVKHAVNDSLCSSSTTTQDSSKSPQPTIASSIGGCAPLPVTCHNEKTIRSTGHHQPSVSDDSLTSNNDLNVANGESSGVELLNPLDYSTRSCSSRLETTSDHRQQSNAGDRNSFSCSTSPSASSSISSSSCSRSSLASNQQQTRPHQLTMRSQSSSSSPNKLDQQLSPKRALSPASQSKWSSSCYHHHRPSVKSTDQPSSTPKRHCMKGPVLGGQTSTNKLGEGSSVRNGTGGPLGINSGPASNTSTSAAYKYLTWREKDRRRRFREEWKHLWLVIPHGRYEVMCLVCHKVMTQRKLDTIKRHTVRRHVELLSMTETDRQELYEQLARQYDLMVTSNDPNIQNASLAKDQPTRVSRKPTDSNTGRNWSNSQTRRGQSSTRGRRPGHPSWPLNRISHLNSKISNQKATIVGNTMVQRSTSSISSHPSKYPPISQEHKTKSPQTPSFQHHLASLENSLKNHIEQPVRMNQPYPPILSPNRTLIPPDAVCRDRAFPIPDPKFFRPAIPPPPLNDLNFRNEPASTSIITQSRCQPKFNDTMKSAFESPMFEKFLSQLSSTNNKTKQGLPFPFGGHSSPCKPSSGCSPTQTNPTQTSSNNYPKWMKSEHIPMHSSLHAYNSVLGVGDESFEHPIKHNNNPVNRLPPSTTSYAKMMRGSGPQIPQFPSPPPFPFWSDNSWVKSPPTTPFGPDAPFILASWMATLAASGPSQESSKNDRFPSHAIINPCSSDPVQVNENRLKLHEDARGITKWPQIDSQLHHTGPSIKKTTSNPIHITPSLRFNHEYNPTSSHGIMRSCNSSCTVNLRKEKKTENPPCSSPTQHPKWHITNRSEHEAKSSVDTIGMEIINNDKNKLNESSLCKSQRSPTCSTQSDGSNTTDPKLNPQLLFAYYQQFLQHYNAALSQTNTESSKNSDVGSIHRPGATIVQSSQTSTRERDWKSTTQITNESISSINQISRYKIQNFEQSIKRSSPSTMSPPRTVEHQLPSSPPDPSTCLPFKSDDTTTGVNRSPVPTQPCSTSPLWWASIPAGPFHHPDCYSSSTNTINDCRQPSNQSSGVDQLTTRLLSSKNSNQLTIHILRLGNGQDLRQSLTTYVLRHHLSGAFIITCCGSLERAKLRLANLDVKECEGPFEIVSLVGTLAYDGSPHLHMAIADSHGFVTGGHLMGSCPVKTTVELVIGATGLEPHDSVTPSIASNEELIPSIIDQSTHTKRDSNDGDNLTISTSNHGDCPTKLPRLDASQLIGLADGQVTVRPTPSTNDYSHRRGLGIRLARRFDQSTGFNELVCEPSDQAL